MEGLEEEEKLKEEEEKRDRQRQKEGERICMNLGDSNGVTYLTEGFRALTKLNVKLLEQDLAICPMRVAIFHLF